MKRSLFLAVVFLVTFALTFGCAAPKPAPTPQGPPQILKIGTVWPLTGLGMLWGLPFKNVIQYQADKVNAQGGLDVGGQKYTLEIIHEDSRYVPAEARKATEKLVYQDKVKFILGPLGGGELNAMLPVLNENKVINIEVNNAFDCLGPDKPYCFRAYDGVGEQVYTFLKYFRDNLNVKTVQCVMDDSESGRSVIIDNTIAAEMLGIKMLETEYFPRDVKDFYPIMNKVLPRNPDMILVGGHPGMQGLQLKVLKELGYKGLRATQTPTSADLMGKLVGAEVMEGYYTTVDIYEGPLAPPLVKQWKAEWEGAGNSWADGGTTTTNYLPLLIQGIQAAGTATDTDKIKAAMEKMTFNSPIFGTCPWGGMDRYGINHLVLMPMSISKIENGKDAGLALIPAKDLRVIVRPK
ncbi:MAG: hypothetical protein FJ008_05520 [Chloroflexi bacterium]|nr:hypothetical protein [Chloroflexota bacterium]MBM3174938.1 hypothetical protein [Chloroflexota bacterium]